MKIDIVCSSGSPTGLIPEDIYGHGVGGAELSLMTFAEVMVRRGHTVKIFNNPKMPGNYNGVSYNPVGLWNPSQGQDAVIVFRNPFQKVRKFEGRKIFWSCDQFTEGDWNRDIFPLVDHTVVISPFHLEHFKRAYHIPEDKMSVIDIGVRTWDYEVTLPKIPNRFIFCSVPKRGLQFLRPLWDMITASVPNATLVITSDYRLWGQPDPDNLEHRLAWSKVPNVQFLGKVPRHELVRYQLEAEYFVYPCIYDELFCISVAECMMAGTIPFTTAVGALATTNRGGVVLQGDPGTEQWRKTLMDILMMHVNVTELREQAKTLCREIASTEFNWDLIAKCWEAVLK